MIRTALGEPIRTAADNIMKTAWIFLLSSLLASQSSHVSFTKAFIYYIPFQFETYEAETPKNIKEKAIYKIEVNDKNKISALLDLMAGGEKTSSFDPKRVRLLIVFDEGKQQMFVDADGNIFDGETQPAINAQNFEKLKNLLSELTKQDSVKIRP